MGSCLEAVCWRKRYDCKIVLRIFFLFDNILGFLKHSKLRK